MRSNPIQAIRTNVFGTLTVAEIAASNRTENFVFISTDKAVRPTNLMGATKRLGEMILQALAKNGCSTVFSMVRFGNVLGSSGSVVPRFREQIRRGGPITLTHQDVTRYFMTIPEASTLVIQAGAMARGGDVFLLEMGAPVRIFDLARRMIQLSGLTIKDEQTGTGDIEISVIGLRAGEKLHEELLVTNQNSGPTEHPKIMRSTEPHPQWDELKSSLENLLKATERFDLGQTLLLLNRLIPEYEPSDLVRAASSENIA